VQKSEGERVAEESGEERDIEKRGGMPERPGTLSRVSRMEFQRMEV